MPTFKKRVETFWEWYSKNSAKFYAKIEAGKAAELAKPVSEAVHKCLPGFSFVFGPGPDEQGHSFTLTGEGKPGYLLLASYWKEQAPKIEGWTFHEARQPSLLTGGEKIRIGEMEFGSGELLVRPLIHEEEELLGLDFWHPNFPDCDENLRFTVFNLWLDESLGELGTNTWVGSAECKDITGDPQAFPIFKLKAFLDYTCKEREWEKLPPHEAITVYQIPEPTNEFPRSDTIAGNTRVMDLVGDFLNSKGNMADPVPNLGAKFIYVGIDRDRFPKGDEVNFREEISEALDKALRENRSGEMVGGALGLSSGYVDLVIYDGNNSLKLVKQVLQQKGLAEDSFLMPFADPKSE